MRLKESIFIVTVFCLLPTLSQSQSCVEPPSDLLSWWPADGNVDDITGSNHGSFTGNQTFSSSKVGLGFTLDGPGNYVEMPNNPLFDISSGFTFEAWVYPNGNSGVIASKCNIGPFGANWFLEFDALNQNVGFSITVPTNHPVPAGNWNRIFSSTSSVPLNQWTHIAGSSDGTNMNIYINGLENNSDYSPGLFNSDWSLLIGAAQRFSNKEQFFSGSIDEVSLYTRALAPQEVMNIFNAGSSGKCRETTLSADIDIKPGDPENSLNLHSNGKTSVAIIGSTSIDVLQIDPISIKLAGSQVLLKGKGKPMISFEDVNGDSIIDLVAHVQTNVMQLNINSTEAIINASTFGGVAITGKDYVNIVQ